MYRYLLLPIPLLLTFRLAAQDDPVSRYLTDSLDAYIEKGLADWQIPGLALAIVRDGEVVLSRGYGTTRAGAGRPVDEHTLFMIGSNTKAFTATTLAMVAEGTDFELDTPVREYLPYFSLRDPLAAASTTTEDLLSHRIGIGTFQGDFTYWTSTLSRREVVERMARLEPQYGFRTGWGYCNAAYTAAGEVTEAITGSSWARTVRDSILAPLGMERTLMLPEELRKAENAASPHTIVGGNLSTVDFPAIDNLAPAGSMSSSAAEMARWIMTQISAPTPAMHRTRRPASILGIDTRPERPSHFHLYGLGWMINDLNGRLKYSHTGGVNGFLSSVTFIPAAGAGVVVLTNSDSNGFFESLNAELIDRLLELPGRHLSDRSLARFRNRQRQDSIRDAGYRERIATAGEPVLPLDRFAGTYTDPVYGTVRIAVDGEALLLRFAHHPDLTARLDYLDGGTFYGSFSDPIYGNREQTFTIEDGRVSGFTLRVADFIEPYPYSFTRVAD